MNGESLPLVHNIDITEVILNLRPATVNNVSVSVWNFQNMKSEQTLEIVTVEPTSTMSLVTPKSVDANDGK